MKSFRLQPSLLRSCAPAMSTEETRYYLKGVHIYESNGSLIYEATNGHIAIKISATLEQEDDITGINAIIPDSFVKELIRPSFLKGFGVIGAEYVDAVIDGQTISIEMPGGVTSNKLVDGTFPNIDAVFPAHRKGLAKIDDVVFNLDYISRIGKSAKAFERFAVNLAIGDNTGPAYFEQYGDRGHWEALLMPMRA